MGREHHPTSNLPGGICHEEQSQHLGGPPGLLDPYRRTPQVGQSPRPEGCARLTRAARQRLHRSRFPRLLEQPADS